MKKTFLIFSILFSVTVFSQEKAQFANVSFGSICCGTSSSDKLFEFVYDFKSKNFQNTIYAYEICCQGKEGEFSIVFDLRNFTLEKKQKFMEGLSQLPEVYRIANENTSKGGVSVNFEEVISNIPFPAVNGKCKILKF